MMKECEIYEGGSWRVIAPMNEARAAHAAVEVSEGVLYVISGVSYGKKYLDTIEKYTRDTNAWELIQTNGFTGRVYPGAVGINKGKEIMIFGGVQGKT